MYTTADLIKIEAAIVALAAGERLARVMVNGKIIDYVPSQLKELQSLHDSIKVELSSSQKQKRFVLASTSKGL